MKDLEKAVYTVGHKIHQLTLMSFTEQEINEINELTARFDDEQIELINKISDIHFKIGFRNAIEFLR